MIIKLTEFDNDPILINTNAILYVRPKGKNNKLDAKSCIVLMTSETEDRNDTIYVKESWGEIMQIMKDRQNSLF